MQDQLGDQSCVFCPVRSTSSRNFAAPDQNVELAKWRVLAGIGEPRHADSRSRGLEDATGRGAVLFDGFSQLFGALENAFGSQRIEERCHGPLNNVLRLGARRRAPNGSTWGGRIFHFAWEIGMAGRSQPLERIMQLRCPAPI